MLCLVRGNRVRFARWNFSGYQSCLSAIHFLFLLKQHLNFHLRESSLSDHIRKVGLTHASLPELASVYLNRVLYLIEQEFSKCGLGTNSNSITYEFTNIQILRPLYQPTEPEIWAGSMGVLTLLLSEMTDLEFICFRKS